MPRYVELVILGFGMVHFAKAERKIYLAKTPASISVDLGSLAI